jgi:hypothetical protein
MTSQHLKRLSAWLLLVCGLTALHVAAIDITKSADDYFHGGAMSYLSNNIPGALNVVSNGLEQFPDDEKLQKLEALLKQQQQQQQQQQNQNQQDNQQQNQDQQKDQQQPQDQSQSDKDQHSKQDDQQQNQQPDQQKDQQAQQNAEGQAGDTADQRQMTPDQALRVLDSAKGDEQVLPLQKLQPPPPSNRKLKDW